MIFGYNDDEELFGSDIQLGDEVYATDPAYTPDLWCCNLVRGFLPGKYLAYVLYNEDEDHIAELAIYHNNIDSRRPKEMMDWEYIADVPVDSGQAGFFDKDSYIEGKKADEADKGKSLEESTGFYKECCDITLDDNPFGTLDSNLGVVSASGYGDGVYELYVVKDSADRIVAARIIFIEARNEDEDDDWDDEDEEDIDDEEEE